MNKGDYGYATDEFDAVDAGAGPRGVHRRPRSRWARIWPFAVVILVFPALAYGAVTYWTSVDGPTAGDDGSTSQEPVAEATPSEEAAEEPVETASPTPVETPAAPADLTSPVVVLNATTTPGLASGAVAVLEDAGWTDASANDFTGAPLDSSTVFYASADLEVTARAAAEELGIGAVELAENDTVEGIEIVLEGDFVAP